MFSNTCMPHILYIHAFVGWGGGSGALCALICKYTPYYAFSPLIRSYGLLTQRLVPVGGNHYYLLEAFLLFSFFPFSLIE